VEPVIHPRVAPTDITADEIVGPVPKTAAPDPVSPVKAAARLVLDGVARNVATLLPIPVTPVTGTAVAVLVPDPLVVRLEPLPKTIAAAVFVPLVIALKAPAPPPPEQAIHSRIVPLFPRQSLAIIVAGQVLMPVAPLSLG
jgi:hypothetical protein